MKVFEAPAELPDTVVIGRLSHYSQVLSFRQDKIAQFINSGVRTARMCIHRHILSVINLAVEIVRVWYPNQPKTCWNSGSGNHLVKDCPSTRCFNCKKPGHHSEKCEEEPKCMCCKSEEDKLADCLFVKYSANVENSPKEQSREEKQKANEKFNERVEQVRKKREMAEKQYTQMQMSAKASREKDGKKNDVDSGKKNGMDNGRDNGPERNNDKDRGKDKDKHEDNGKRGEKRSRSDERRSERSEDDWEKQECWDSEAWKEERRRKHDRDDHRERDYSRHDDRKDRSSRRDHHDYYSDDDGWTKVSYRRGRRRDY